MSLLPESELSQQREPHNVIRESRNGLPTNLDNKLVIAAGSLVRSRENPELTQQLRSVEPGTEDEIIARKLQIIQNQEVLNPDQLAELYTLLKEVEANLAQRVFELVAEGRKNATSVPSLEAVWKLIHKYTVEAIFDPASVGPTISQHSKKIYEMINLVYGNESRKPGPFNTLLVKATWGGRLDRIKQKVIADLKVMD